MKKVLLTGLTAAMLSSASFAGEVTGYSDVTAGTPATAAAVNGNFQALISAINDNAQRIAVLEAATVNLQDSLTGATFSVFHIGGESEIYQDSNTAATTRGIGRWGGQGTITLNGDSTVTTGIGETGRHFDLESSGGVAFFVEDHQDPDTPTVGGSWALNGQTLSILFPGDTVPVDFTVAADGAIVVSGGGSASVDTVGTESWDTVENYFVVGVRLSAP